MYLHTFEQIPSTQDIAHQLAADGAPAGTTVVAAEQSGGRGSRGRHWHSPRGGLWLSVVLRPVAPIGLEVLSLRAGLAVAEVLAALPGLPPVGLKWPNDLILGDRKVGGILGEARWQGGTLAWVIIGLGLNVTNPLPPAPTWAATRLAEYRPDLIPEILIEPIARAIIAVADRGGSLDPGELAAFTMRDWLRGKALCMPVAGHAAGITRDGVLIVRTHEGRDEQIRSGSVVVTTNDS